VVALKMDITENLKNITGFTIKETNLRQFYVPKEQTASKRECSSTMTEDYIDNDTYLETNTSKKQMNVFNNIIVNDTVENTLDIADAVYKHEMNHEQNEVPEKVNCTKEGLAEGITNTIEPVVYNTYPRYNREMLHRQSFEVLKETGAKYLGIGMRFPNKEDACAYIQSYCNTHLSPMITARNSISGAKSLRRISFKCPHGMKKRSKSTGKRKAEVTTAYVGCPVRVNLNQQNDGSFVVTTSVLNHESHEASREMFEKYAVK
jgi:hypothetical protein